MREIKFRAWDKKIFVMLTPEKDDEIKNLWNIKETHGGVIKYPDGILMQYTGLKDKNGKEIYEGDIVRGTEDNEHQGQSNVFIDTWSIQPFHYLNCYDTTKFEVIGNIYENPELLGEKQ